MLPLPGAVLLNSVHLLHMATISGNRKGRVGFIEMGPKLANNKREALSLLCDVVRLPQATQHLYGMRLRSEVLGVAKEVAATLVQEHGTACASTEVYRFLDRYGHLAGTACS